MILWWPGPWTSEGMTSPPNYPVKRKVKEESKYTLQCCKSNQKFCVIPWVTEWCPRTVKLFEVVGRGQWPGPWTNGCTPWQSATRPGSGCVSSFILCWRAWQVGGTDPSRTPRLKIVKLCEVAQVGQLAWGWAVALLKWSQERRATHRQLDLVHTQTW